MEVVLAILITLAMGVFAMTTFFFANVVKRKK